jgi:uncharacterized protein YjbJ (UPF0337 family)
MLWDQIEANWRYMEGKVRQNWEKLTDDDLAHILGRREALVGRLKARYGIADIQAEREIDAWTRTFRA